QKQQNVKERNLVPWEKVNILPKQVMQVVIKIGVLLFFPVRPCTTEQLFGQGGCWKTRQKALHSR
ncbi:hypothetical protein ACQP3C_30760, partial [Escherichia coli]